MGLNAFKTIRDPMYYPNEVSDPAPETHGKLAGILGIEYSEESYLSTFAGLNPHNGQKLPGIRIAKNRVGGWDMTFNQEKWMSVLELVAGDERIGEIRRDAAHKAMEYAEGEIRAAVRKKAELDKAPKIKGWKYPERITGNGLWHTFNHYPSREGDPNGHVHAVLNNLTFDPVERQFKAAVTGRIDIKKMENIYHTHQVKALRKIGYDVKREGERIHLKGFPKDIHDIFSQRAIAIKETEAAMQAKIGKEMSAKAKGKLSLYNRPEKEYVPIDVRRRGWLSRLSKSQLTSLSGFVKKSLLKISADRLHRKLKAHAAKLRFNHTPEKEQDRGIGR